MIQGLNTYRFFAFFAVFLSHVQILVSGYLGVSAFFVLSGFLITPILLSMKAETSSAYFIKFYGRRSIRIFPLYYFYLAAIAFIFLVTKTTDEGSFYFFKNLPYAITYTFNFFHASSAFKHTDLLSHFWSLAVEEQFYLLWPLLLFFIPNKFIKHLLIFFALLSPILRWLFFIYIKFPEYSFLFENKSVVVYVLPTSHLDAFAIGGLFALFIKNVKPLYTWAALFFFIAIGIATHYYANGFLYFQAGI